MGRQLALSEAMLASLLETSQAALRWYIPTERALVLGNGQPVSVAHTAALAAQQTMLYKRSSGGAAVLVDSTLLSLDIALPHDHPLATGDVIRAYQWVGALWVAAIRALGGAEVRAIPTEETRAIAPLAKDDPLRLACYGTLSPWEVVCGSGAPRKLVGLCQVRRRAGTLYQTGVYLHFDAAALASLLALTSATRGALATRLSAAAIGLDHATQQTYTAPRVMMACERALRNDFHAELVHTAWLPSELAAAADLETQRFARLV
jgi:lipoate-protein ligase A